MRLPGQSICICICMCISACIFICTFRPCVHVSATVSASVSVAIAFAARARLAMPESNSKRRQSGVVTPTKQSDCQWRQPLVHSFARTFVSLGIFWIHFKTQITHTRSALRRFTFEWHLHNKCQASRQPPAANRQHASESLYEKTKNWKPRAQDASFQIPDPLTAPPDINNSDSDFDDCFQATVHSTDVPNAKC